MVIDHGNDNQVTGNDVVDNNLGVIVVGDANTVSRNRVADVPGQCEGCGFGISFEGGRDNLIANNTVERAQGEAAIRVAAFEPETPPAMHNTLRSNVVAGASLDGISVDVTAAGTLLDGNLTFGAGDDGIDVDSPTTTLRRNTANRNHDLGIEAVPGVTDGGGNMASGNGNPLQCTNIFCR